MPFDLSSYETVEERLRRFWDEHPNGRVLTLLVHTGEDGYIVKASVWRDAAVEPEYAPHATGYAAERVTERGVNATSALENCETSAIGRALANLGYAPKGKRPSREEMDKVNRSGTRGRAPEPDPVELGSPPSPTGSETSALNRDGGVSEGAEAQVPTGSDVAFGGRHDRSEGTSAEAPADAEATLRAAAWEELTALAGSRAKARGLVNSLDPKLHVTAATEDTVPIEALLGTVDHVKLRGALT